MINFGLIQRRRGTRHPAHGTDDAVFTRATTAYKQDGSSVASGAPRYETAATGFSQAITIEKGATNLLIYSDPTALAQIVTQDQVSIAAAAAVGAAFAGGVVFGDNSVLRYAYITAALAATTAYFVSAFVKMDDGGVPSVSATGTSGDFCLAVGGVVATEALTVTALGGGLYRCSGKSTTGAAPQQRAGALKYTTQSNRAFKVSGFQVETTYRTSYIATAGASATRNAETLTMLKAGKLQDSHGTVECRVKPLRSYGTNHQYIFDGGGALNANLQAYISSATGKPALVYGTGSAEVTITSSGSALVSGTHYGIGWGWSADSGMELLVNGVSVGANAAAPGFVLADTMYKGCKADGSSQFDGLLYDLCTSFLRRPTTEIKARYDTGAPLVVDGDTGAIYPFNESLAVKAV
jgi:hypothetical protein